MTTAPTVIVGNGVTGITAARFLRKADDRPILVISDESRYFWSRTALMYIYMGQLTYAETKPYEDFFWDKNRITLVHDRVEYLDANGKQLHLRNGKPIPYSQLILAVGSVPVMHDWKGMDLEGVQGMYGLPDLERLENLTPRIRRAVVVGGGLIGVELAEMLHSRQIPVTFLVREPLYFRKVLPEAEAQLITRHLRRHGIDLRLETELAELIGEGGRVRAVRTKSGEELPCDFVGITIGVRPNVDWLRDSPLEIDRGILVNRYFETNLPEVYSAGDCAQFREPLPSGRTLEQLWYTGRMQGECLAYNLTGQRVPYDPGVFYNSAKFFDIEYQTYGQVPADLPAEQATLYWQHPREEKAIRVNYDRTHGHVVGFNVLGIRYRHEVCRQWIEARTPIREVLSRLPEANFDPEFAPTFEHELVKQYNRQHPEATLPVRKRKRGWWGR